MSDWALWWVLGGLLIAAELFTGTFYLLMIALGFAAGGAAALASLNQEWQLLVAAIVGVTATVALHRSRFGIARRKRIPSDHGNLDIGQVIVVNDWLEQGGQYVARARYRGADWDIDLEHGGIAAPGQFFIREVRGSRLLVANSYMGHELAP